MDENGLHHRMLWGPSLTEEGSVRFRLWAPAAAGVSLRIGANAMPMQPIGDGWFEIVLRGLEAGTPYCFQIDDGRCVPDPASRAQESSVDGPSLLPNPAFDWTCADWPGRPWSDAVLYELHVGTFTPEGTFRAAAERLSHLADLGITAIELMPVGQFAGNRGWGYDGVLPYAPHPAYGTAEELKHLVDTAHSQGMMVLLDVVYNHFGPEGNHLSFYAPHFFDPSRTTPWGSAIDYRRQAVRSYFIENALYWIGEFRFDGLRLDAIDQIQDPSDEHVLVELARAVRRQFGHRNVHLVTEDARNITHLHQREHGTAGLYTAEWNDDFHNAAHVVVTGETDGYYSDFAEYPHARLARCLAEGFAWQGEPSAHAGGRPRGEDSTSLPTTAFIDFLQNHDQIGNRALGERLETLAGSAPTEALTAILLLSPHIPMLFMGEEWGETHPFLYFTDYQGELAAAVRDGRRREFAPFQGFGGSDIPDPNARSTFDASRIDWGKLANARHRSRLETVRSLLQIRRTEIVPRLFDDRSVPGQILPSEPGVVAIRWQLADCALQLRANLSAATLACPDASGTILYRSPGHRAGRLGPWQVEVLAEPGP